MLQGKVLSVTKWITGIMIVGSGQTFKFGLEYGYYAIKVGADLYNEYNSLHGFVIHDELWCWFI